MSDFNVKVVKIGTVTVICAIIANFIPVLYMWLIKGIVPELSDLISLYGVIAASFCISWVIQPLSFYGGLGMVGSYISWIAGNAAEIRCPATTMAQRVSNTEPNTPEGDAIGAIALSTTVFVTVTIISIFTAIGSVIIPMFPKAVVDSFTYIQPSLFAAVFVNMAIKNLKSGIPILAAGLLSVYFLPKMGVNSALITLVIVVLAMVIAGCEFKLSDKSKTETK